MSKQLTTLSQPGDGGAAMKWGRIAKKKNLDFSALFYLVLLNLPKSPHFL